MSICAPTLWLKPVMVGVLSYLIAVATPAAQAQIQPDASLGPTPSRLTTNTNGQLIIEGGAARGAALFHSFSDFNIAPDGNAFFTSPNGIETILTRVTGDRPSNLLGTLGVLGNADLFFINPNGITFGQQSALDLNGSFVASTATDLVFGNDFRFGTAQPQSPPATLTLSIPTGLQFGQQPGPISYFIEGNARRRGLRVPSGKTIGLLGGTFNFRRASLSAVGGRIELGSIAEAGTVGVQALDANQGWRFNYDGIAAFDDITAARSSITTTIQDAASITSINPSSAIVVNARDIALTSTQITANTWTDFPAGDVAVNARRLILEPGGVISSRAVTVSPEDINGSSGDVVVNASEEVRLRGGTDFGAFISPTGISSDITGEFTFGGFTSGVVFGDGGDVIINTKRLSVLEGAAILARTSSAGDSGDIFINATESIEVGEVFSGETAFSPGLITTGNFGGTGAGGTLSIKTKRLTVRDAGNIRANSTDRGPGGNIEISADVVEVIGGSPISNDPDIREISSEITTSARGAGDAGSILIDARTVRLEGGGEITTETLLGSSGNGNLLTINARDGIQILGSSALEGKSSGLFSSSAGTGNAGVVQVNGPSLKLLRSGQISAATLNETAESSGSLELRVARLILDEGDLTVETFAQQGSGANISISDLEVLLLRNGSQISAEALNGADGGNIVLDAPNGFVVATLQGDSDILARANRGNGGEIAVVAQNILGLEERLATPDNGTNDIDASSQFGLSGSVILNQLALDPSQGAAELPTNTEAPKISQQCNPRQGSSSFVATGRGGAPPAPNAVVPSLLWNPEPDSEASISSAAIAPSPHSNPSILEAQGWATNINGTIQLTTLPSNPVPYTTLTAQVTCSLSPA